MDTGTKQKRAALRAVVGSSLGSVLVLVPAVGGRQAIQRLFMIGDTLGPLPSQYRAPSPTWVGSSAIARSPADGRCFGSVAGSSASWQSSPSSLCSELRAIDGIVRGLATITVDVSFW